MKPFAEKEPEKVRFKRSFVSLLLLLLFWIFVSLPSSVFTRKGMVCLLRNLVVGIPLSFLVTRLTGLPISSYSEITAHRLPCVLRLFISLNISPFQIKSFNQQNKDYPILLNWKKAETIQFIVFYHLEIKSEILYLNMRVQISIMTEKQTWKIPWN